LKVQREIMNSRECMICGAKIKAPRVECSDCENDLFRTASCPDGYGSNHAEMSDEEFRGMRIVEWF